MPPKRKITKSKKTKKPIRKRARRSNSFYNQSYNNYRILQEKKAFDVAQTSTAINLTGSTPVITPLNCCVVGSELYQRIGRRITMKSLHVKYWIQHSTTTEQSIARVAIIYDENPKAALPVFLDIFADSVAGAPSGNVMSGVNLNNRSRFKILRDSYMDLPAVDTTNGYYMFYETGCPIFAKDIFIKLPNLVAEYNNTNGGTIADIQTGALYLVTAIYNVGGQNADWNCVFQSRLRYYD